MMWGMAKSYLPVDRSQPFLLPPDMREWLAQDHLAWFVIEVVERVDTSVLHARRRRGGVGRRGYDPDMLLALLIYAYCTRQRSSRQIERLCEVDVAYRVICGGSPPDHTTIARFRQDHQDHAVQLFTDVLAVCAQAGLASVGTVAVDGTKMGCDASLKSNRTREWIEKQVGEMFDEAAAVDDDEDRLFGDARGDEVPERLRDRSRRGARLDSALREVNAREQADRDRADADAWEAAAWAAAEQGEALAGRPPAGVSAVTVAEIRLRRHEAKAAAREAAREAGCAVEGDRPRVGTAKAKLADAQHAAAQQPPAEPAAAAGEKPVLANTTDPDSRTMKTRNGWSQGYNAQAAVNGNQLVLSADVTQDHNDVGQLEPMIRLLIAGLLAAGITAQVGLLLFDAGYWSEDNATAEGPDRLIATTKDWKRRRQLREQGTVTGPPPDDATPKDAMEHRLCTVEGSESYAKRATTVEPVFGNIKENLGYRRFVGRGLDAVRAEWLLITSAHNLLIAYRHSQTA